MSLTLKNKPEKHIRGILIEEEMLRDLVDYFIKYKNTQHWFYHEDDDRPDWEDIGTYITSDRREYNAESFDDSSEATDHEIEIFFERGYIEKAPKDTEIHFIDFSQKDNVYKITPKFLSLWRDRYGSIKYMWSLIYHTWDDGIYRYISKESTPTGMKMALSKLTTEDIKKMQDEFFEKTFGTKAC